MWAPGQVHGAERQRWPQGSTQLRGEAALTQVGYVTLLLRARQDLGSGSELGLHAPARWLPSCAYVDTCQELGAAPSTQEALRDVGSWGILKL